MFTSFILLFVDFNFTDIELKLVYINVVAGCTLETMREEKFQQQMNALTEPARFCVKTEPASRYRQILYALIYKNSFPQQKRGVKTT